MASKRRKTATPFSLFAFQDIITSVTGIMILITLMLVLDFLDKVEGAPASQTHQMINEIRDALKDVNCEIDGMSARESNKEAISEQLAILDVGTLTSRLQSLSDVNTSLLDDLNHARSQRESVEDSLQQWQRKDVEDQEKLNELKLIQSQIEERKRVIEKNRERINKITSSDRAIFTVSRVGGEKPWLVEIQADQIRVAELGISSPPQVHESDSSFLRWLSTRDPRSEYLVILVSPESIDHYDTIATRLFENGFPYGVNLLRSGQSAIDPETGAAP
ncbi:MAG: hypothetical protein U0929_01680 [Planctomycetaceae bacterium]